VPLQLAPVAPVGTGQGVHELPHELTESLARHWPSQLCVAPVHMFMHAVPSGMQVPAHSCLPAGHAPPQRPPLQVAVPPAGAGQGVHELPQVAGSLSLTQRPSHRCEPGLQVTVHVPDTHAAAPSGSPGHMRHELPHAAALSSRAQPLPQRW
jgi:hypothetical protein